MILFLYNYLLYISRWSLFRNYFLKTELEYEFEEIEGNGFCLDSNGFKDVAKINYKKMTHEEAREICQNDDGCVAYAYSLDNMLRDNSNYVNAIIYSTTLCTNNCEEDSWQQNPDLITQTGNNGQWNDGKCYVKRSYDYYVNKCKVN